MAGGKKKGKRAAAVSSTATASSTAVAGAAAGSSEAQDPAVAVLNVIKQLMPGRSGVLLSKSQFDQHWAKVLPVLLLLTKEAVKDISIHGNGPMHKYLEPKVLSISACGPGPQTAVS